MATANANIGDVLERASGELESDSARLDAECLMTYVLGKPRSYLFAWPEKELTDEQQQRFEDCLAQRKRGQPIAYITGEREFWSLPLKVGEGVLIPRPDTEILVEEALKRLPADICTIADLGTGSGAIALALAHERADCHVIAVDRSDQAITTASANAAQLGLKNVEFRKASWCEGLDDDRLDMIVSNPPYIPLNDPHLSQGDVRFEPAEALVSGDEGLDDIRQISEQARNHLKPGGWLLIEHGYDQAEPVSRLFLDAGFGNVETVADLGGNARVTLGHMPA